jgi:CRP/FNR family transcriptional regulator, cyclic AMP receptor protein
MQPKIDFAVLGRHTGEARSFSAGQEVFQEGDPAAELFVVREGSVELRRGDRLLETVTKGGVFGEMALIDTEPRSATAIALTDTVLASVTEKQFLFMISEAPYFALSIMQLLARRLRTANTKA